MRSLALAACAALLLSSSTALAWNGRGHMMVADVAWKKLTPATRSRVIELLRLNPDFATWVQGIPIAKRGEVAFMRASKWADDIKSRAGYTNGNVSEPGAAGGSGYDDMLQHRYWHFKDKPFSLDGAPLEQPYDINAETQIIAFRNILGSIKSDEVKSYSLVWLVHLVGDVHQPLHATTRFSKAPDDLKNGDRGGNKIKIKACASCSESNLHSYWDGLMGKGETPSSLFSAVAALPAAPSAAANNTDVASWIDDSFAKAKDVAYAAPIKNGVGPYTLTTTYKTSAKTLARKRVALAGARLAKLIEESLN